MLDSNHHRQDERVLVLAPLGRDGPVTAELLRERGLAADVCADAADAGRQMAAGAGVLMVTEEALEQAGVSELFAQLQAQPQWSELPLIILTSGGESRLSRLLDLAAQVAGGVTLLERPLGATTLLRNMEVALRSRRRQYQVRDLLEQQRQQTAAVRVSEERLRESEQRMQQALGVSRSFTFEWLLASDQVIRSDSCATILGLTGDDIRNDTGQRFFQRVHPDDRARFVKVMHDLAPGDDTYRTEYRLVREDSRVVVLEETGQAAFDADGKLQRLVGVTTDMTARKQAEDVFRFLGQCGTSGSGEGFFQELARYLARALDMEFVCIDRLTEDRLSAQTLAVFHNGRFEDNVSYTLKDTPCGEVVGKRICCFPQDVRARFPKDAVLQELQAESYLGTTLRSALGKPIGLIAVIGRRPLTDTRLAESMLQVVALRAAGELERQQAEEALRAAGIAALNVMEDAVAAREQAEHMSADLRVSEERLGLAVSGTQLGMFDRDIRTGETRATEQQLRLLCLPPTTTTTTTTTTLSQTYQYREWSERVHPEDLPGVEADMDLRMQAHAPFEAEYRIVWPDGSLHWLAVRAVFQYDAQEQPRHMLGIAMDVTRRRMQEDALRRLNKTLEALSASSQAMMRATDETAYVQEVCRIVVEDCGHPMVWAGYPEQDEGKSIRPVAAAGFEDGYLNTLNLTWADTERGRGPTGRCIRTGQVCECRNMQTDPAFQPWRDEAVKRGYASSVALPLMSQGKTFGALMVYSREAGGFADAEARLLRDLADDLAHGITLLRVRTAREQADLAVRQSEERYRTLFTTMAEGFALHEIICDSDDKPCDYRFLDINPVFERMTGLKRADVIGRTVLEIMPDTESVWIERYGRVALTGETDHFEHASAALGRHYEVIAYRAAPRRFAVIFNDITELRAMQQREKEDAVRLAWGQSAIDTINAMRDGVVLLEMDGTITWMNPAVEQLTDLSGAAVVGRNITTLLSDFMDGTDLQTARQGLTALSSGSIPEFAPLLLRRPDGKAFHVLPGISLMDVPEGGRQVAVLTLKDVTDMHESSRRLRELAGRLAVAEEEDRWRISRYVHDTVIQNLSLSNIRLGSMARPLADAGLKNESEKLRQIRGLLSLAIDECRMVMSDLTPALLYELGLVPALKDLARQLEAKHGTRILIEDCGQEQNLSRSLRGLLFEATRELVINALKHAGPCEIRVTVSDSQGNLVISVADNGAGVDPSPADMRPGRQGGFGLFNIRQRVEGLGGCFDIKSARGRGMTATIILPVTGEQAPA